jgi:hypothetical protein
LILSAWSKYSTESSKIADAFRTARDGCGYDIPSSHLVCHSHPLFHEFFPDMTVVLAARRRRSAQKDFKYLFHSTEAELVASFLHPMPWLRSLCGAGQECFAELVPLLRRTSSESGPTCGRRASVSCLQDCRSRGGLKWLSGTAAGQQDVVVGLVIDERTIQAHA